MVLLTGLRLNISGRFIPRTTVVSRRNISSASSSAWGARTAVYATALTVSSGLFAVYYFDCRSAIHRYFFTPVLRYGFDAETGHKIAVKMLRSGLAPKDPLPDDERVRAKLWDSYLSNPVGLAAGFDKDGEAVDGLFELGFSWVEIGSVTPKPQSGNPKPRVFHLPEDDALINRYGFPSQGHAAVAARLRARTSNTGLADTATYRHGSLLAVNLGKNKDSSLESVDDFVKGVRVFGPHADVLVINVSSPNTPGLRGLQTRTLLEQLLRGASAARDDVNASSQHRPKLMLKLAPDLTSDQVQEIAEVVRGTDVDGVIVSNTTVSRPSDLRHVNKAEMGGLSGSPLKPLSLSVLRTLRAHLPAETPIIGCGGITSGADALEYARAGASLVQIYTHFGYDGVGACRRIKDELAQILQREGTTWEAEVGKAVRDLSKKEDLAKGPTKTGDEGVKQLIEEAEGIRHMLEALSKEM